MPKAKGIATNQSNKSCCFSVPLYETASDISDECGLSNEVCHELLPKKGKVMLC